MSKFGPSGSLKKENIALENAMDVIPRMSSEVLFDLKYMFVIILEIHLLVVWMMLEPVYSPFRGISRIP